MVANRGSGVVRIKTGVISRCLSKGRIVSCSYLGMVRIVSKGRIVSRDRIMVVIWDQLVGVTQISFR